MGDTIYGTNFLAGTGEETSPQFSPMRAKGSEEKTTEVILSKYARQAESFDSGTGIDDPKEKLILYGDGNDVFSPNVQSVPLRLLKDQIKNEVTLMEQKRPFQRL